MDDKQKLELERKELNSLIEKGVTFEIQDIGVEKRGWFRKRKLVEVTRKFTINELTLATLDRISAEGIEMAINEAEVQGERTMEYVRGFIAKHGRRCARIIAVAVLNESRLKPEPCRGGVRWVEDTAAVERLTDLFVRTIQPSKLHYLTLLVNAMSNIGDFVNSIRLMQAERTTMPNLIESK